MSLLDKIRYRVRREVLGTTKGERQNTRRLRQAQDAWRRYHGPLSHRKFLAEFMRSGVPLRNKEAMQRKVGRMSYKLRDGKTITTEKLAEILYKLDFRRTPVDESHFAENVNTHIPGGAREYGTFKFGGTFHTPDFYVNKNLVIEYKVIRSNTEFHAAIGQSLIYHSKYKDVFLVMYDARQGFDAVAFTGKEMDFLADHNIYVVKYPK